MKIIFPISMLRTSLGLRFTWFIFYYLDPLSPFAWFGVLSPKEQARMNSKKNPRTWKVLKSKTAETFTKHPQAIVRLFLTHAIKLPEVIQTRTRDELTSRFAILKSKLKRMAILMQGTINLIALFFTHIQSTPSTSPSKNEWKLECHTYTRAKKLSNTWSNITAIKHATFLWTTGQWFTSYKEFYIHSLQFSNCWENFLWIIHESLSVI